MDLELDAKTYRAIAAFLEQDLEELIGYSEQLEELFVPVVGNLQYFSQPVPEITIISQQLDLLQDRGNEAIEILNLLAFSAEEKDKLPLPSLLKQQLNLQVAPFIQYYKNRNQPPPDTNLNQKLEPKG